MGENKIRIAIVDPFNVAPPELRAILDDSGKFEITHTYPTNTHSHLVDLAIAVVPKGKTTADIGYRRQMQNLSHRFSDSGVSVLFVASTKLATGLSLAPFITPEEIQSKPNDFLAMVEGLIKKKETGGMSGGSLDKDPSTRHFMRGLNQDPSCGRHLKTQPHGPPKWLKQRW